MPGADDIAFVDVQLREPHQTEGRHLFFPRDRKAVSIYRAFARMFVTLPEVEARTAKSIACIKLAWDYDRSDSPTT